MLSIETEGVSPERRAEILNELRGCFAEQESVQAVTGTYAIRVIGYGVYEHIQKALLAKTQTIEDCTVRFVMTPLIHRGVYHGRMGAEAANTIQSLTD